MLFFYRLSYKMDIFLEVCTKIFFAKHIFPQRNVNTFIFVKETVFGADSLSFFAQSLGERGGVVRPLIRSIQWVGVGAWPPLTVSLMVSGGEWVEVVYD